MTPPASTNRFYHCKNLVSQVLVDSRELGLIRCLEAGTVEYAFRRFKFRVSNIARRHGQVASRAAGQPVVT
jgi:hypothetical protein